MVFSPVHPFRHCGRLVHESLSVKCPHEILCGRATERSTRIEVTDEYPLLQFRTFNRQFKQVGTLPDSAVSTLSFTEFALQRPVLQVGRRVYLHFLPYGKNHDPFLGIFVPDDFRVTEVALRGSQDGISRILLEGFSVVKAIGHALHLAVACRCIEGNDGTGTEPGRIILVDNTRATENCSQRIGRNGISVMLPSDEVRTGGMSPMHVPPHGAVGIMLVEQMVDPVFVEHSVRIIHPTVSRAEMIHRTEFLPVRNIEFIRQFHFFPA